MRLNLFRIAYPVTSLGPGKRLVIWVAGCRKRCPGCISPEMRNPDAGSWIEIADLADHILRLPHVFDGITVSGGEPFDQPLALASLLRNLRTNHSSWDTLIYSGYCLPTLKRYPEKQTLLAETDILIDGPYRQNIPSSLPLAGSGNQQIHFLSKQGLAREEEIITTPADMAEVGIGQDGMQMLIGVLSPARRNAVHETLGLLGKGIQR